MPRERQAAVLGTGSHFMLFVFIQKPKKMNGFRLHGTQLGELGSYRSIVFASLLVLYIPQLLIGQTYTYHEEGTNLSIEVSDQTTVPISYKLIKFEPPYTIDPTSPFYIDWAGSWLCQGGNCSYSMSFDASSGELTIEIEANEARAGAGRLAFVKGIIIEPVDIEERIGRRDSELVVYPNPAAHRLLIKGLQEKILHTEWISLDGKTVAVLNPDPSGKSLDVSGLARGLYAVIFKTESGKLMKQVSLQ